MALSRLARRALLPLSLLASAFAGRWLFEPLRNASSFPLAHAENEPGVRPKLLAAPPSRPLTLAPSSSAALAAPAAEPREKPPVRPPTGFRGTLLVGVDHRADRRGAGLADSIVLGLLDDARGEAALVSIPRDLWVTIPDHGDDRINVVPAVAQRSKRDPIRLFARVIEDTLGLPVAHAIILDLGVFERAVDVAGGVEVTVPCPIIDSFHDERAPGGRRRLDLAAGSALLDGATAAMYVRSRHGRSDFGRSRRQQAVLLGLRDRVLSSGGITVLPDLVTLFEDSIQTDLRRYELLDLARRALTVDRRHLHGLVLGPPLTTAHATDDGKSVLLPDREAIAKALAALPSAPPPGDPPTRACPPADAALRGR